MHEKGVAVQTQNSGAYDEGLAYDILMIVGLGGITSYADVCNELSAYKPQAVVSTINALHKEGRVARMDDGYFAVCRNEREGGGNSKQQERPQGEKTAFETPAGIDLPKGRPSEIGAPVEVEGMASTPLPSSSSAQTSLFPIGSVSPLASQNSASEKPTVSGIIRDNTEPHRPPLSIAAQNKDDANRGKVLYTSPITLLGLSQDVLSHFDIQKNTTVGDAVKQLAKVDDPDAFFQAAAALARLSGTPTIKLDGEGLRALQVLEHSTLFGFDCFGLLCASTSVQRIASNQISLEDYQQEVASLGDKSFSLGEFSQAYNTAVFQTASELWQTVVRETQIEIEYERFGLHVIVLLDYACKTGECSPSRNAMHDYVLDYLTTCSQLANARYAGLRDRLAKSPNSYARVPDGKAWDNVASSLVRDNRDLAYLSTQRMIVSSHTKEK